MQHFHYFIQNIYLPNVFFNTEKSIPIILEEQTAEKTLQKNTRQKDIARNAQRYLLVRVRLLLIN